MMIPLTWRPRRVPLDHYYVYIFDRDFGPFLIARVPHSHRYRITETGAQVAMFYARLYTRALRPACSLTPQGSTGAHRAYDRLDAALANFLKEVKLAA